jgi:hypothetical protein
MPSSILNSFLVTQPQAEEAMARATKTNQNFLSQDHGAERRRQIP